MDELFEAINVRDLLSAGDFTDPSSPLSAPDLRLLISRLESHSLQIKSKVQSYLLSHQNDFASLFSLCNDTVSKSDQVNRIVSDLLHLVSDSPVDVEIKEIVEEVNRKMKEARVKRELLELVRIIVGIDRRLKGVKDAARNGQLRFAAEEVKELKKSLRIGEEEDGEPVVYGLLRKEWLDCFEEIQESLIKFMETAVHFDRDSSTLQVVYHSNVGGISGVDLRMVLEAMEVAGILNYGLAKVADQMIKFVFTPAVNCHSPISFVEDVKEDSGEFSKAILKLVPLSDAKMNDVDGDSIYTAVIQVIKFVHKYMCFETESWIHCFGRLTWPSISQLIITSFLSKAVPDDASKLSNFQKIIERTSQFENTLRDLNFVSHSDNTDRKLTDFVENVEVHFASKKKMEILANARRLLLRCDFTLPQEYKKDLSVKNGVSSAISLEQVVDLLFLSKKCVVSEAASQLVELVHCTLKDVCLSSPKVAVELYHVARDALLLYEAIIPVKLERQLDSINQAAVLMHNDCLYLSQEILGLAFEYRPDFPLSLKEHAVFVDLAPRFHLMAEETLKRQVKLIIHNLKEAVDGANGFQNTHQIQPFESAKFSIEQVVFIIEKVHIIWEPILLPLTYKKSMCTIIESVFSAIARDILLIDDLAAEETLQLQRLIHLMLESLSATMDSLAAVVQQETAEEYSRCSLEDHMPSLRKVRKLTELLDMPLKYITTAWESGELLACGFTISEVKDFIKAVFADSPLRKECLWRIENVSL